MISTARWLMQSALRSFLGSRPNFSDKQKSVRLSLPKRLISNYRPSYGIGIVGAPISQGQSRSGVELGPRFIREAGLVSSLQGLGLDVTDYGDLYFDPIPNDPPFRRVKNPIFIGSALKKISLQIQKVLKDEDTCLLLGGDHSIGTASIHAFNQVFPGKNCHIWVDAHADINTALTTNSGNMHGMPVSLVLRELANHNPSIPGFEWLKPCINATQIAYIGLRDVEPLELSVLHELNIKYFSMKDIDRIGIHRVIEEVFEAINPKLNKYVHVSFDIDSIDSHIAPSTGTPVKGGLTRREALIIGEEISATCVLKSLDLVEVNPSLGSVDDVRRTVSMAVDVISTFLSQSRPGLSLPKDVSLPKP